MEHLTIFLAIAAPFLLLYGYLSGLPQKTREYVKYNKDGQEIERTVEYTRYSQYTKK
ncbi:MAG: hypothetical protein LBL91_05750 [Lachnospiraceae bacterium]|jgi:hypothetical protein|nr:hypothetical protein [Lachnospiraceae bacterium]